MSAMLTMAPSSSMKATESGTSVFFIHMQWGACSSKMKSIPAFCARLLRYMRPWARLPGSETTSARMRCMPALSWVTGFWASADVAANERRARAVRINGKGKALGLASSNILSGLLLGFVFLGGLALLRFALRLLGALLGALRALLAVLLVHLAGLRLVVRLLLLRDGGHARGSEDRRDQHRNELLHSHPLL